MIKQYFKQALAQLRQQPLLTTISVLGTALTICLIMVVVMQQQIKTTPFAPESNRNRLLHVKQMSTSNKNWSDDGSSNGPMGLQTAKGCFEGLTTAEEVSIYTIPETMQVALPRGVRTGIDALETDGAFWRIFDFSFIDGKPYSDAEVKSGLPVAVITESVARLLFGTSHQVSGKEILVNDAVYRISGVVKDVSSMASTAYAQIWVPYSSTHITGGDNTWCDGIMGVMRVVILARSSSDFEAIRAECERRRLAYNAGLGDYFVFYRGQPDDQLTMSQHKWANVQPDMAAYFRQQVIIFLILLLVPAINLSSMTYSRLRQRVAEIGVRRSFGATRGGVMGQIVAENLVLTLMAGVVGLLFCLIISYCWGGTLFADSRLMYLNTAPVIEWKMLFKFSTFIYALLFCLALNLLSSGWPAWRASRMSIINALSGKLN